MITTISETSIEAYNEGQGFITNREKCAAIVKNYYPLSIVGADVIAELSKKAGHSTDFNTLQRLSDAWRETGEIRKTGTTSESKVTGKRGDEWIWVPDSGDARVRAKLEYWQKSFVRHQGEASNMAEILARDEAAIAKYRQILGIQA